MDRRPLATRPQLAEYLGVAVTTLDRWAYLGTGPRYVRVGRQARYSWADVDSWLASQAEGSTQHARSA